MQAMMISPTSSSIIYPNGSPSRSPKGVMDMIVFQPSSPPKMPDISSFHGVSSGTKISVDRTKEDHGSSAYIGHFSVTPSDDVLRPILQTYLATNRDPRVAWRVIMEDMFVHRLGLQKCSDNIFCGNLAGGQRVVINRSGFDEITLGCSDAGAAAEMLLLFESNGIHVHEI